ncbi:MAG: NFACT RNA binding domain-containing protein [Candidatus Sericytochromatia bacterium]
MVALSQPDLLALHAELASRLNGGRLQAIKQLAPRRWSLEIYTGQSQSVQLDFQHGNSLIWLGEVSDTAQTPDGWTLLLRKMLLNTRLQRLEQASNDRIWHGYFEGAEPHELVCELSGRHANLFLLDAQGRLIQSLQPDRSQRGLRRGEPYTPPPPPSPFDWPAPLKLALLPPDGSRSQAVAQHRDSLVLKMATQHLIRNALANLRQKHRRAQAQHTQLSRDIDALAEAAELTRRGELLQGAYGKVKAGQTEITLPNYFDPELRPITLALAPDQDLATQIQRAFQHSRKRERAAERALGLWEQSQATEQALKTELEALETLAQTLHEAARPLTEAERAAFTAWLSSPVARSGTPSQNERTGWRKFIGSGGEVIRVGRSARDNEALSFRQSRGSDLWLHVRNYAGSHVVVSLRKGQTVHPETLLEAASLALHYSEARGETQAEILYTPLKYVHRLKGGAPGQVQLQQSKTLLLRQDPQRWERLRMRRADPPPGFG